MKYRVPLYKLVKREPVLVKEIDVEKTSLGLFDLKSGVKVHLSCGAYEDNYWKINYSIMSPFVRCEDLNAHNLLKYYNQETQKVKKKVYIKDNSDKIF